MVFSPLLFANTTLAANHIEVRGRGEMIIMLCESKV